MKYIYMKRGQLSRIGRSESGYDVCPASMLGWELFSWAPRSVKIQVIHVDTLQDGTSTCVLRGFETKFCIIWKLQFWIGLMEDTFSSMYAKEILFN